LFRERTIYKTKCCKLPKFYVLRTEWQVNLGTMYNHITFNKPHFEQQKLHQRQQ